MSVLQATHRMKAERFRHHVAFGGNMTFRFSSGTLVTDGTNAAAFLGQYVATNFHLSFDGHGGTVVVDPPVLGCRGYARATRLVT